MIDPPRDGGEGAVSEREQAAAYVAELSGNLAAIARRHGLDALGYILDMARIEAVNATRHINGRALTLLTLDPQAVEQGRVRMAVREQPGLICSARTKSRILKSMCAVKRFWS